MRQSEALRRVNALLGRQHDERLSDGEYAVRLDAALQLIDTLRDEPEMHARLVHVVMSLAIDDLSWWQRGDAPAAVSSAWRLLQQWHLEAASNLPPTELASWLARNYAGADSRLHVSLAPYLPLLDTEQIEQLTTQVRRIDRFNNPDDLSTSHMLARELALYNADVDQIVAEFGGQLSTADDFLGVSRAFQFAGLPLQAEAWARRGSRLPGPSALLCRMVVLEFHLSRDPDAALDEARRLLAQHPTREVAAVIRRGLRDQRIDPSEAMADVLAGLTSSQRASCLLGFALPVQALEALRDSDVDVRLLCQTIDLIAELDRGPQFVQEATHLLSERMPQWPDDADTSAHVRRSLDFAQSVYPELDMRSKPS